MAVLRASTVPSIHIPTSCYKFQFANPRLLNVQFNSKPTGPSISTIQANKSKNFKVSTILSSSSPFSESIDSQELGFEANDSQGEKFDWFSQWYPVMPVCDLDKRVPHAKKIMGLDVVVWWDRNEGAWKVFDDSCPHRLAPLSEGRIDQWGRLQCVYHGWCFNGSGDCKFIPQAPLDGPPVHKFKKACAAIYPSTVHHDIVWFWPSTDPQYKDIIMKKRPPFIPELDDPSFAKLPLNRDFPFGYEILMENLMDPAHLTYAHYGLLPTRQPIEKRDREGGIPIELRVKRLDVDGFVGKQDWGSSKFFAPCVFYSYVDPAVDQGDKTLPSAGTKKLQGSAQRRLALVFICVPVSPGNSRLISFFPRNFATWKDRIVPRWIFHLFSNLVLDSDLSLLHMEERKVMDKGIANWQKTCFVPTKSDAFVVGYRRWLKKYAGGQVDWRGKYSGALPPIPPREQLMDRYSSHVVNCSSCNSAYKGLNALEVILQAIPIVSFGIVAAYKQGFMSAAARNAVVLTAVACFVASRWLAHFIYKNFHYHDYNHTFRTTSVEILNILPW